MSTTSLASSSFIVRPLDGTDQVYEGLPAGATVRDLKERIFVAEGIQVQHQKLIFGPEIMEETRTLESYHIPKGFVVRLLTVVHPEVPKTEIVPDKDVDTDDRVLTTVFVKSVTGPSVRMENIKLVTTLKDFRNQYCLRQGSEPDHCRLIFSGKELEDVRAGKIMTLKDYSVQNESTIHEVYRLPGGYEVNYF